MTIEAMQTADWALWKYQEDVLQHLPPMQVTWSDVLWFLNSIFNRECKGGWPELTEQYPWAWSSKMSARCHELCAHKAWSSEMIVQRNCHTWKHCYSASTARQHTLLIAQELRCNFWYLVLIFNDRTHCSCSEHCIIRYCLDGLTS